MKTKREVKTARSVAEIPEALAFPFVAQGLDLDGRDVELTIRDQADAIEACFTAAAVGEAPPSSRPCDYAAHLVAAHFRIRYRE